MGFSRVRVDGGVMEEVCVRERLVLQGDRYKIMIFGLSLIELSQKEIGSI